ncbi:MAG: hypothetical protein IJP90_15455 [Treponema sp.]|nr:hypothetical protein [Treponema sp.]
MKIPSKLFDKQQIDALGKIGIVFDFDKDYTDNEVVDIEDKLQDACLDYGFNGGEPNDKCAFWEKICDAFQDMMDGV